MESGESSIQPTPTSEPAVAGRSRRRLVVGCAIAAVIVAILLYVGVLFLGSQVAAILKGTVEFGTAGSGCQVSNPASRFTQDQTIHVVAHLRRDVHPGETVTLVISQAGTVLEQSSTAVGSDSNCLSGSVPASVFPAGHIDLKYLVGDEVVAQGAFDVAAP